MPLTRHRAVDGLEASINGERVLTGSEWISPRKTTVTGKINTGRNVIAIRAYNGDSSPAGAIARLTITTKGGTQVIVTNASWKASNKSVTDRNKSDFSDTCRVVVKHMGKLGSSQWNDVFSGGSARAWARKK